MVDVLALGSHPDDIEFGCGGILIKLAKQGKSIVMADLTLGERGTHGTPQSAEKKPKRPPPLLALSGFS